MRILKIGCLLSVCIFTILSCRTRVSEQFREAEEKVENHSPDVILHGEIDLPISRIGEFSYLPPEARFRDCITDSIYKVLPSSAEYSETRTYSTLITFYTTNAPELGLGLYLELEGYDVKNTKDTMYSIVPVSYEIRTKEETACW